jgi:hypothetical protein
LKPMDQYIPPEEGPGPLRGLQQRHGASESSDDHNQRPRVRDQHIEGYFKFMGRECRRLKAGRIARFFLREATLRFKQFRKNGDPDFRRLTWSAIQLCASYLEKEANQ